MMDSRLDISLSVDTPGAGVTVPTGQSSTAVGWTQQDVSGLLSSTGVNSTDIFTSTAHGLVDGDAVYFSALTGGSNLTLGATYYVITATANTFQLSTTFGGSAVNLGSDVSASTLVSPLTSITHTLYLTPNRYGERWEISRITVQNTSALKVPTASIYRGVLSPSSLVDVTQNGANDVDDLLTPISLSRGEAVIIQFTGVQAPPYNGLVTSTVFLGGTVYYA